MVAELVVCSPLPAMSAQSEPVDPWHRLISLAADPKASASDLRAARERAERPSPLTSFPGSTNV